MPPKIQEILNDPRQRLIYGGALAGVIVLIIILAVVFSGGGGSKKNASESSKELPKERLLLAQVATLGRSIEIQAMLAKQGIHVENATGPADSKIQLVFTEHSTYADRDKALIALVQSGLMDSTVGLESFDKGDLTASREEKRIKLIRAQQGELIRLIKKIDPIEDAAVSIAIPEPTIFRADEKPVTATVQVSLPSGSMLTNDQVRAISNLVVGSVQGLDDKHLAISDTNGHTYNSILDSGSDMGDKLREQDSYMRQKVVSQLDRLLGTGNYVVTVSTEMRQAPRETMVEQYDPQGAVLSSKQSFNENLNSKTSPMGAAGPASMILPPNMENSAIASGTLAGNNQPPGKDYLRNGVEVAYRNSKMQWLETSPAGMIEDISIAVTVDNNHYPEGMNSADLQLLIARSASPKVRPENVSIARTDMRTSLPLSQDQGGADGEGAANRNQDAPADMSWVFWAGGAVLVCVIVLLALNFMGNKKDNSLMDESVLQAQHEMQQLRDLALQQQEQLQMTQQQTQLLMENQQRQMEHAMQLEHSLSQGGGALGGASRTTMPPPRYGPVQESPDADLQRTLDELRDVVDEDDHSDDALDMQIRNWIESA